MGNKSPGHSKKTNVMIAPSIMALCLLNAWDFYGIVDILEKNMGWQQP